MVFEFPIIEKKHIVCARCLLQKRHQKIFLKEGARRAKEVLELVHADVCGPMNTLSRAQNVYFILFIDHLIYMM